jgi:hypothetical protein
MRPGQKRRARGPLLLLAFAAVYIASLWVSLSVTPVGAVSLGISRGAAVLQIRKPVTEVEAASFNVPRNVPGRFVMERPTGGVVWWFRGFARLRHYLRNDPELQQSDWVQAQDVTFGTRGTSRWQSYSPQPVMMPVAPSPGVAPWLPLSVEVPLWAILAAFAAPWFLASIVRTRRRRRASRCASCGYDLRGIGGAVCPECGAEAHRPAQSG